MARNIDTVIAGLPAARQQKIDARYRELLGEIETLKSLRRELGLSQTAIAKAMKMSQPAVSRIENEADMLVSTLRGYVEALGGELGLVVRPPGGAPVRLGALSDLVEEESG